MGWVATGRFGGVFLLDASPYSSAMGAWGLAKLRNTATAFAQIKRSGDNATQDFGFSGDAIDSSAVVSWVVAGGGTQHGDINILRDQSGNGLDMTTQSSGFLRLVSGGALNTLNDKPCGIPTSSATGYQTAQFTTYTATTLAGFYVGAHGSANEERSISVMLGGQNDYSNATGAGLGFRQGTQDNWIGFRNGYKASRASGGQGVSKVWVARFDGTNYVLNLGGTTASSTSSGSFGFNRATIMSYAAYIPGTNSPGAQTSTGARFHATALFPSLTSGEAESLRAAAVTLFASA